MTEYFVYLAGAVIGLFSPFFMVIPVFNILRLSITPYIEESHSLKRITI